METTKNSITGLLIRSIDYKDTSKIIYILTNEGIKSIICKGVKSNKSKLKSDILLYNYATFFISNGKIPILTDISLIDSYKNLKENINKYMYAGSIINMLFHQENDDLRIFDLTLKILKAINDFNEDYYYNLFLLKNLYFLGVNPNFKCICGNNKNYIGFNIRSGSSVCNKCNINPDIDYDLLNKIFDMYYAKIEDIIDVDIKKVNNFLNKYYNEHTTLKI